MFIYIFHLFKLSVFVISITSDQLQLLCQRLHLPGHCARGNVNSLLLLLEFLHLGFQVVHVDLHFMLKPDVPSDVGF